MIHNKFGPPFAAGDDLDGRTQKQIAEIARQIRVQIIKMTSAAKSGHPGGSLSIADIMAYLFFAEMRIDPQDRERTDRDRFVLSKGHAAPALYATLALRGFFPEADLVSLRKIDSHLQGHPHRLDTPGVEASTGSLGQGLSMACGIALGLRISGLSPNVFCIIGDGESQEGQIWEAAMAAGFRKLSNLCVFLDYNNLQIDGRVTDIKDINPIREKWVSFRWHTLEIDGHDLGQIHSAVRSFKEEKDRPTMIICRTVKGKGVSFMENQVDFHGVAPNAEETEIALKELSDG